jgi:hypothetical protein
MPLADTLLRFAEVPRLYFPLWTDHIIAEVSVNLVKKFGVSSAAASRRAEALREAFPRSWVTGYSPLIKRLENDPKDRHVLAAAVRSGARVIVTYNVKHFPERALAPFGIEAKGPAEFLVGLYELDPELAMEKLGQQAQAISIPLGQLLGNLRLAVPSSKEHAQDGHGIKRPAGRASVFLCSLAVRSRALCAFVAHVCAKEGIVAWGSAGH